MKATASVEIGAERSVTEPATSELAGAPFRDIVSDRRAANADHVRPKFRQLVEAVASGIVRALASVAQRQRDDLERRQSLRELRLLGPSRLVDIGIEPNDLERVVDEMIAARRRSMANGGRHMQPRSE